MSLLKERDALELLARKAVSAEYYYELLDCMSSMSNLDLLKVVSDCDEDSICQH